LSLFIFVYFGYYEIIYIFSKNIAKREVSKRLKISQQSVSDRLKRSKYKKIRESEEVLIEIL
jgi:Mn-dependent DtxR family transcriptional regulator